MGNCWGARNHPGPSGMFSRSSGKDGSRLSACSSRASSASMPPSAKTECEILQSANVKVFSYNDLRLATRNFRPDSVLGEGGFGSVYKGWIDEHTLSACKPGTGIPVAVKRLNQEGLQGHREWLAEVNYLGQFCHTNLVKLIGYCLEDEYRLLVYECMPRGSLENHLFRRGSYFQPLSWNLRMKVALGAAKGLAYLHSAEAKVIYRDFKTSNILLDTDYTAKLSDFGLAKDGPVGEKSHVSTRVMGTYGYAAPEYLSTGMLSRCSGKDGSRLSACIRRASSASVPLSAKTCEILQSANVKVFSYKVLRLATRNFHPDGVLGKGGLQCVYKGWIDEHTLSSCKPGTGIPVAVRKFNDSSQGQHKWQNEVNYLGQFCHPNVVKLIGYCLKDKHWMIVCEWLPRGSLENHLFGRGSSFQPLPWNVRMKVALGAAKGLAYLHSAEVKVIYRDFKTSKILLDRDYTAKLYDFRLAKDGPVGEESHLSTRVMGTLGYIAPEYILTGHLTTKSDIYSFGVVLLEMLSGRRAWYMNMPEGELLVEWAWPYLTQKPEIFRVLDNRLEGQYSLSEAQTIAALAVECLNSDANMRPSMEAVVSILEGIQDSSDPTRRPAAERQQETKGAGKEMTSESVGRNSGKPRWKSSMPCFAENCF